MGHRASDDQRASKSELSAESAQTPSPPPTLSATVTAGRELSAGGLQVVSIVRESDDHSMHPPHWVTRLHHVVTLGDPDPVRREQELRLWQSHASEMAADPAVSPVDFLAAELCSAVAHVGWRFKVGAPTLLLSLIHI